MEVQKIEVRCEFAIELGRYVSRINIILAEPAIQDEGPEAYKVVMNNAKQISIDILGDPKTTTYSIQSVASALWELAKQLEEELI